MDKCRVILHLIGIEMCIFAVWYDVYIIGWGLFKKPTANEYSVPLKGRLLFLTIWNLVSLLR